MIKLGNEVLDTITGFQGVVVGIASYLTGCNQMCVQPMCKAEDKGTYPESKWFDEGRLVVTSAGVNPKSVQAKENGSDYTAPTK